MKVKAMWSSVRLGSLPSTEPRYCVTDMTANLGHKVIFYPKFHCELYPIEPYWCKAKWSTGEQCDYSLEKLRQTVFEALASVEQKTICGIFNRSMRIIEAIEMAFRMVVKSSRIV